MPRAGRRKFLVPEVVQTSAMDCGPACLKALLEGFGVRASYGRLREACQTDVDGTSIDAIEDAAVRLGLRAEQRMAPLDHLLLEESRSLPAMVVVVRGDRTTHFVVAWRRHGRWVQVMDPAAGRRWMGCGEFMRAVFQHAQRTPADEWRSWAGGRDFQDTLARRMTQIGVPDQQQGLLLETALADANWRGMAALDAAVRMSAALAESGGVRRGKEAARITSAFSRTPERIPRRYWSVTEAENAAGEEGPALLMEGAVLLHVAGSRAADADEDLSPELRAALTEPRPNPLRALWTMARSEGWAAPAALAGAAALAAAGVVCEGLLLRGLLDIARHLPEPGQRAAALAAAVIFAAALTLVEWPLEAGVLRVGRRLEGRLRIWFLEKVPRLGDRYFQSRLVSDMAQRAHSMHLIRALPTLAGQAARAGFSLLFTAAAIAWLYPRAAPLAFTAALLAAAVPALAQGILGERDLRRREHEGALSLFFFDALRGMAAIRAHGAAPLLRRAHADKLAEWTDAGLRLQRAVVAAEGVQLLATYAPIAALVLIEAGRGAGGLLLLVYWALSIPAYGQEFAAALWQYPGIRNITLRLLEPLAAPEQETGEDHDSARGAGGVAIRMENVRVVAAGQTILHNICLRVDPGEHLAIVGLSGAGKSSLAGLLLGWHRAESGAVSIDGAPLDPARLERLRTETAWIDPEVYLWNERMYDNLMYGNADGGGGFEEALAGAELGETVKNLPNGFETPLGEGGGYLSAGEAQRVRIGRAFGRQSARLAILDEPARGLERDRRREISRRLRERWKNATLLSITHDLAETRQFKRVLVLERGCIVEDGEPAGLWRDPASRYRALCEAEHAAQAGIWGNVRWRRLRMRAGSLEEDARETAWTRR